MELVVMLRDRSMVMLAGRVMVLMVSMMVGSVSFCERQNGHEVRKLVQLIALSCNSPLGKRSQRRPKATPVFTDVIVSHVL
jgi:hypothetical protein